MKFIPNCSYKLYRKRHRTFTGSRIVGSNNNVDFPFIDLTNSTLIPFSVTLY